MKVRLKTFSSHNNNNLILEKRAVKLPTNQNIFLGKRSLKSIDQSDKANKGEIADDEESVTSLEYYNTTTSIVRFAIDLDVNSLPKHSDEDRWSWEGDNDAAPLAGSDELGASPNKMEESLSNIEDDNIPPPNPSRFSITKFHTDTDSTANDSLTGPRCFLNKIYTISVISLLHQ